MKNSTIEQKRLDYYNNMIEAVENKMYPLIREIQKLDGKNIQSYAFDTCINILNTNIIDLYANTLGKLYYYKSLAKDDLNYAESNI